MLKLLNAIVKFRNLLKFSTNSPIRWRKNRRKSTAGLNNRYRPKMTDSAYLEKSVIQLSDLLLIIQRIAFIASCIKVFGGSLDRFCLCRFHAWDGIKLLSQHSLTLWIGNLHKGRIIGYSLNQICTFYFYIIISWQRIINLASDTLSRMKIGFNYD